MFALSTDYFALLTVRHVCTETELSSLDPNKVTVEERKDADGASVISISVNMTSQEMPVSVPGQPSDFSFPLSLAAAPSGREAVDTNSTLTDAEVLDLQRLPAKITQISRDKLEVSLQPLTAEDQAEQEKEHRPELVYDSRDHDSDDDEDEEQVAVSIEGNPFLAVLDTASSNTDSIPGAISEVVTRQIKKLFPGQVISPEELEGLMNKDLQKASDSQPSSSSSGLNRDTASGSNAAPTASTSSDNTLNMSIDEIASTSGRETDAPADDSLPSWETVVGQVLQVVQQLKRVAPKPGDSTEEKQQHMDLMQKLDEVSTCCISACQTVLCVLMCFSKSHLYMHICMLPILCCSKHSLLVWHASLLCCYRTCHSFSSTIHQIAIKCIWNV